VKAEIVLFGKPIRMTSRRRRRTMVVVIYAVLAPVAFLFSQNPGTGHFLLLLAAVGSANRFLLGGQAFGGIIKPFNCKILERHPPESSLADLIRWGFHRPKILDPKEFKNDERELLQRDHAYSVSYQALSCVALLMVVVLFWKLPIVTPFGFVLNTFDQLALIISLAFVAAETLPQAILLWTELDLEEAESPVA
jgi:hypothetical protein